MGMFQWGVRQSAEVENLVRPSFYPYCMILRKRFKENILLVGLIHNLFSWYVCASIDDLGRKSSGIRRTGEWSSMGNTEASSRMAKPGIDYFWPGQLLIQFQWASGTEKFNSNVQTQREGKSNHTFQLLCIPCVFCTVNVLAWNKCHVTVDQCPQYITEVPSVTLVRLASSVGQVQERVLWSLHCSVWQSHKERSMWMVC